MKITKEGQSVALKLDWEEVEILYHTLRYIRKGDLLPDKYYNHFLKVEVVSYPNK